MTPKATELQALLERVEAASVAIKRWASGTGDAEISGAGVPDFARARAASPALALLVAILKAMIATQGEKT